MKFVLNTIIVVASIIANTGYYIGGLAIHIWTVYIIYVLHGFFGSTLAFFLPGVSQLYLMFKSTLNVGFFNTYNLSIIVVFLLTWVSPFIMGFAINRLKKLEHGKNYHVQKQEETLVTSKKSDTIVIKKSSIIWGFLIIGVMIFTLFTYLNKPTNDSSYISNVAIDDVSQVKDDTPTFEKEISPIEGDISQIEETLPATDLQPKSSQIIDNSPSNELTRLYPAFLLRLNKLNSELESGATVWETGSTLEILEYSQREYEEWDKLLNDIFNSLKEHLTDKEFIKLRDSQRAWIVERDQIAKNASKSFEGGTLESPVYISTQANETKLRCYWLIQNYMH